MSISFERENNIATKNITCCISYIHAIYIYAIIRAIRNYSEVIVCYEIFYVVVIILKNDENNEFMIFFLIMSSHIHVHISCTVYEKT